MAITDPAIRLSISGKNEITDLEHLENLSVLGKAERDIPALQQSIGAVPISLIGMGGVVDKIIAQLPYSTTVQNSGTLQIKYETDGFYNSRDLVNETVTDYTAHLALTSAHIVADTVDTLTSTTRLVTIAETYTMVNDIKAKFNAHIADCILVAPVYHAATGTDYTVVAADAISLSTLLTLANAIKTQYELHRVDATAHTAADTTNIISTADATDPGVESFDLPVSKTTMWNTDRVFGSFITQVDVSTDEVNSFEMKVSIYTVT